MTNLTFQAQNGAVALDDRSITLLPAAPSAGGGDDDGTDGGGAADPAPVVIPRSDVTAAELKPATLLAYGRLIISTGSGETHTIEFSREAQDTFTTLHGIIRP